MLCLGTDESKGWRGWNGGLVSATWREQQLSWK